MVEDGARRPGGAGARGMVLLLVWVAAAGAPARVVGVPPLAGDLAKGGNLSGLPWRADALQFTVADDRFRNADDAGFTSYQAVGLHLSRGPERLRLTVSNQMITERDGMRRVDEGNVVGAYGRRWSPARVALDLDVLVGLSGHGDLGGAWVQDGYHALLDGRRLGGTLQDRYPDRTSVAGLLGGFLRARWPEASPLAFTAGGGGTAAMGGGVSRVRGALGLSLATRHLRAEAGDEIWRFFSRDPFLTMPGGYVTGAFVHAPYLRVAVILGELELEYEARANAGGSGQGISQVALRIPLR